MTRTSELRWAAYYYLCAIAVAVISALTFVDGHSWIAFWEAVIAGCNFALALQSYRRDRTL